MRRVAPGAVNAAAITSLHSAGVYDEAQYGRAVRYIEEHYDDVSAWYPYHFYFWYGNYYACQAFYQAGGARYRDYQQRITNDLLRAQRPDADPRSAGQLEVLGNAAVEIEAGSEIVQRQGHELKLVYPQSGAEPERYTDWDFRHFYLQPMDSPQQAANIQATLSYCLTHPQWRLSLQTHKIVGID